MLEQLLDLVKGNVNETLKNDPSHNDLDHDAVSHEASNTILSQLGDMAKGGDFSGITELFNGKDSSNSALASQISPGLIQNLVEKLGIGEGKASNLVQTLLPGILNMFNNKVNNAQQSNGFDISSLIGNLMNNQGGNSGGGIADIIGNLFNGNNDTNARNTTDNNNGGNGGDIMDTLKGLFN